MTKAELEAFLVHTRQAYMEDRITHGGEDPRDAEVAADEAMLRCFPDGQPAEAHAIFTARDAATGERTGVLWLFERQSAAGTSVFIYDVEVDSDRRGHGWGRELMTFAQDWAGLRGAHEIALNVFGGNKVARGLYTSLGYNERAISMAKSLKPLPADVPVAESVAVLVTEPFAS